MLAPFVKERGLGRNRIKAWFQCIYILLPHVRRASILLQRASRTIGLHAACSTYLLMNVSGAFLRATTTIPNTPRLRRSFETFWCDTRFAGVDLQFGADNPPILCL